ncbi:MAG: hypothetical protein DRP75_00275 [Candidatus Omnitrophota bacterium]|nr:MAG: hypothetical protein DRP75_00275 [Candidatus Omnitrophota bacterium]
MNLFLTLLVFIITCFSSISPAYGLATPPLEQRYFIRVAILKEAKEFTLSVKGRFEICAPYTDQVLQESQGLHKAKVVPIPAGIKINKYPFKICAIKIKPKREAAIFLNRYRLRGNLEIIRQKNGRLLAINEVDIEDYLCGVLRAEVSPHWPMEVLKAQAVAARTFALYQALANKDKDYALDNTIYSQLYGGVRQETWRTRRAVYQTKGEVLKYKGKLFPAFFHAICGGHTEDASKLWKIDIPPLKGVNCPFCFRSPYYHWRARIPLERIRERLNKEGYKIEKILSLSCLGYDESGRVERIEIRTKKREVEIPANRFRLLIGSNLIRSTNFRVKTRGDKVIFEGIGWGHGVGLCQWGAYFMAKRGFDYHQILEYYYPQAKIVRLY